MHTHRSLTAAKKRWQYGSFAPLEYTRFDVIKELYDLRILIEGMEFNFIHRTDKIYINADRDDFWCVLHELTHNSKKHNEQNETIEATISIDIANGYVVIVYRDNNLCADNKPISFGNGLALIRTIVENHKGVFDPKLIPGASTEFAIHLPLDKKPND